MEHLTAFLTRMPKVELHVHLESTMPGEMLARFAARQGRDGPFFRCARHEQQLGGARPLRARQ